LQLSRPRHVLQTLTDDLMGKTADARQAIYLSDGRHFERLGLYEMLRRRCSLIVAIDAGEDPDCTFADFGDAIRKAGIDQLGTIKMEPMRIWSRAKIEQSVPDEGEPLGFAVGNIVYPDGSAGRLLYIKPSFLPDIGVAVRAYGAAHPTFPHEATPERWFTEDQFESYRALGFHQASSITTKMAADAADRPRLGDLFDAASVLAGADAPPQAGLSTVSDRAA
jgi:hypothetical protein